MSSSDFDDKISKATLMFELEDDCEEPPFDDTEFDRDFEDEDFESPEEKELFRSYCRQVNLSQGFDLELDKPLSLIGGIVPYPNREKAFKVYEEAEKLARLAVGINNCRPISKKLEFIEVQKVNLAHCAGYSYLITFLAKDCSSGRLVVYQTKIHDLICGEINVTVFREKPQISDTTLFKSGEVSSSDSSDLDKDYDYLISNKILVFEVETDCDETSSDESGDDLLDEDDVFNSQEHKELFLIQSMVLDLELDKPLAVMSGMESYPSREETLDLYVKAEKLARLAVGLNNCRPVRKTLEFVEIQKLNRVSCSGFSYFITFIAKDYFSGQLMVYETKIQDLTSGTIKVVIFRKKSEHSGMKAEILQS